jgi:hypothetical protein
VHTTVQLEPPSHVTVELAPTVRLHVDPPLHVYVALWPVVTVHTALSHADVVLAPVVR